MLLTGQQPSGAIAKFVQSAYNQGGSLLPGVPHAAATRQLDDMVAITAATLASQQYPESRLPPATSQQVRRNARWWVTNQVARL